MTTFPPVSGELSGNGKENACKYENEKGDIKKTQAKTKTQRWGNGRENNGGVLSGNGRLIRYESTEANDRPQFVLRPIWRQPIRPVRKCRRKQNHVLEGILFRFPECSPETGEKMYAKTKTSFGGYSVPVSGVLSGNGREIVGENKTKFWRVFCSGFRRALRKREQRLQRTASRRKGCRFPESTPETGAKIATNG